jgi:hypothetical protein
MKPIIGSQTDWPRPIARTLHGWLCVEEKWDDCTSWTGFVTELAYAIVILSAFGAVVVTLFALGSW